ncbi:Hypothetical protein NTJ_04498 [Nesidiocoris tenuis]|uniref:Obg domain-containing protein n=1 Tax=Nesidiocoris tenuis TaxID=355587 RepID=A0ABN7AHE8_9HEMI|nr:Hypothetical protein NTJ_04498 [Nesidiocoris tenuis]
MERGRARAIKRENGFVTQVDGSGGGGGIILQRVVNRGGQMRVGQRARRRCDERAKGGEFGGEGGVKLERADLPSTSLACPWHVADPPAGPLIPALPRRRRLIPRVAPNR